VAGKEPREVAGLGRPETPLEKHERVTAARAERRARQSTRNLVWSLLVSLGVVALLIIVVVRPDTNLVQEVDWREVASQSADFLPGEPLSPNLSELWVANRAEIVNEPGSAMTWSIGLLGPENSYVSFDQGFGADASWIAKRTDSAPSTGEVDFGYNSDSVTWKEYDRTAFDAGSLNSYVVVLDNGDSIIAIAGTSKRAVSEIADDASFQLTDPEFR